ncbi:MAG: hypothetical protein BWY66_02013 [bacterium ADurb.Bin374]|nr:MAG: hypothetical protein BWY66_02013 [bacterium ADurb.Bin374]
MRSMTPMPPMIEARPSGRTVAITNRRVSLSRSGRASIRRMMSGPGRMPALANSHASRSRADTADAVMTRFLIAGAEDPAGTGAATHQTSSCWL